MSRSVHSTRNEYRRQGKFHYADEEVREARLEALREELGKKRRIKRQAREERDSPARQSVSPVPVDAIPITVVEEAPWIIYPAGPVDLRAVMARLPPGALDGLSHIRLCLGLEYHEEKLSPEDSSAERDPWVGRVGYENVPGVFGGHFLGTYSYPPNRIDLYAYLIDPALPDRPMWELFFRLRMLSTFVHEVAHHQDHMLRVGRGRWRMDDTDKNEDYATTQQGHWVRDVVVPYIEQTYPDAVAALSGWLRHHGGTDVPLLLLADTWGWDTDGKLVPVVFGSALEAIQYLARAVHKGETLTAIRLNFARDLHYGANFEEALRAIDRVLAEEPHNLEALTLRADIFEHQEEYARAEALAREVIERDERYVDAWMVLADIHMARLAWPELLDSASRGMATTAAEDWRWGSLLAERARALLELERFAELAADLDTLAGMTGYRRRRANTLRAIMLVRTGKHEEAFRLAQDGLSEQRVTLPEGAVFRAVRFEAAHLLGRPGEAGELDEDDLAFLRRTQHEAWVDRLVKLYGLALPQE
jgi:tetratricopeptide (TPR) repeat protein